MNKIENHTCCLHMVLVLYCDLALDCNTTSSEYERITFRHVARIEQNQCDEEGRKSSRVITKYQESVDQGQYQK